MVFTAFSDKDVKIGKTRYRLEPQSLPKNLLTFSFWLSGFLKYNIKNQRLVRKN